MRSSDYRTWILLWIILIVVHRVDAQEISGDNPSILKHLSMEELMNVEVTSVSKRPEKLLEVASAIQVITQEDIYRSGATCLPEALRLAPNLQVAQLSSQHWIIGARGFNAAFANKLLVMIDGRTVYSPLFAGVFWDAQQVLLEDVERIEVISGPGGTLWGANAVNGVINIITKTAEESQGFYASIAAGSMMRTYGAIRYGGKINSKLHYRIFTRFVDRDNTLTTTGEDNPDNWGVAQTGFSVGWNPSQVSTFSFQGNVYSGIEKTLPDDSHIDGQNILAKWNYTFSEKSEMSLQFYFDRTWRKDIPSTISDELKTYDMEFQHRTALGRNHRLLWGLGYRLMDDKTINATPIIGLVPRDRVMDLFSVFLQDEIRLLDQLRLTLGSKVQHNEFSGLEVQPSVRLVSTLKKNTLWAAVSRAIRAPSRIDVDYYLPTYELPDDVPHVAGGPNFDSEKVISYELGYRVQPTKNLSFSIATFYSCYDDLYSVEARPGTQVYEIQNGVKGTSRGFEFFATAQMLEGWRLRGGYTYFYKELEPKPGRIADPASLGNDPEHQVIIQSMANLSKSFQLDATLRYVDKRPVPYISDYITADARIAWITKHWEVAVVGQNLFKDKHIEYLATIPRSAYLKITCRF